MPRRPLDLPPEVAQEFMRDLEAYFAATTGLAKEEIAARQLRTLREHLRPSDGRLTVNNVRDLFEAMAEQKAGSKRKKSPTRNNPRRAGR